MSQNFQLFIHSYEKSSRNTVFYESMTVLPLLSIGNTCKIFLFNSIFNYLLVLSWRLSMEPLNFSFQRQDQTDSLQVHLIIMLGIYTLHEPVKYLLYN